VKDEGGHADRGSAVREWLDHVAKGLRPWSPWKKLLLRTSLEDAYYRGYDHGHADAREDREGTS
jgi:hypothetical protein